MAQRLNTDNDGLAQIPVQPTENLMRQICLNEPDSGYASLPRTDAEEDIVLRL